MLTPTTVSVNRKAKKTFQIGPAAVSELKPLDIVRSVRDLITKLTVVKGTDPLSVEAQRNATFNFFALLRATLLVELPHLRKGIRERVQACALGGNPLV